MSQSPAEAVGRDDSYEEGWKALNSLLRRGYSWSGHERHAAFLNTGDGFADASITSGLGFEEDGRAAAPVDWDFDGDLDLVVTARTGPRVRFLRNGLAPGTGFCALRLVQAGGNPDAIGARVVLRLEDGGRVVRGRRAGEGYLAQQTAWLHFGLGGQAVAEARVRWPGGAEEAFLGVRAGGWFVLHRGTGRAAAWNPPGPAPRLTVSDPRPPQATVTARVVLPAPLPVPRLEVEARDGRRGTLFGVSSPASGGPGRRPLLVSLWASWCAPCSRELQALAAAAPRLRAAGVDLLAMSLDAEDERFAADALLDRIQWPFPAGYATPETAGILDVLQGAVLNRETRLPLPASLLLDARGRLGVIYLGPVGPERILADLEILALEPVARRNAAVPFPGTWHTDPRPPDLAFFERSFARRGRLATAREFHLGQVEFGQTSPAEVYREFGRQRMREGRLEEGAGFLQKAVDLDPGFGLAWYDLGVARYVQGRLKDAVPSLKQAVRLSPAHARSRLTLGLALLDLGDVEGAREQLAALREEGSPLAGDLFQRLQAAGADPR